ncbi:MULTISPECIES: RNA ligase family protein [Erysipelotrichaceae]|uniref:RNA ligase family protein n=1 Tax=Erysipelotrichaceae TaxID=128827 RepID=UPI000E537994|nr:RNA ligase family protein [Absiella sp. AM27-20]RHU03261.1 hypothetical protein DW716_15685 [Absiella sp. AM27-20]
MEFKKYQHVCRLGTQDTEGILEGNVIVQPKIDGCNTTVFLGDDGEIHIAGRNKEYQLGTKNDRGLINYISQHPEYKQFLVDNPRTRLYMEYLVPHSLRTYKDEAWKKPYVFDVVVEFDSGEIAYVHPSEWQPEFSALGIPFIPNIWEGDGKDLTVDKIKELVNSNMFLIDPDKGTYGEGIVIKNYDYRNKYGNIVWAKVLHDEYHNHASVVNKAKAGNLNVDGGIENDIVEKYCTSDFVEKEYQKIINDNPYLERKVVIPKLICTAWKTFVEEEAYNFVKENKNPVIDFRKLNNGVIKKIKEVKKDLF